MKKFISKILPACVIVIVILLILLGLRSRNEVVPSYRFLDGRNPITCKKAKTGNEDKRYTYSFEVDFNDVCSKADAELIPTGFASNTLVFKNLSGNEFPYRVYWLKGRFPRGMVWIYIYSKVQYIELPDSKKGASCEKDGWVMVEIVYWRGWRWPF